MCQLLPELKGVPLDYGWGGFVRISMNQAPRLGRLGDNPSSLQVSSANGALMPCGQVASVLDPRPLKSTLGLNSPGSAAVPAFASKVKSTSSGCCARKEPEVKSRK